MKRFSKYSLISILFLTSFFVQEINAQTVIMKADSEDTTGVYISWLPASPKLFEPGKTNGYTLIRTDSSGNKIVLAEKIMPRDSNWFKRQVGDANELYYRVIYDMIQMPDFTVFMQHNLLQEAEAQPELAVGLGLGFFDNTAQENKIYKYELFLTGSDEPIGSIEHLNIFYARSRSPETTIPYILGSDPPLKEIRPTKIVNTDFIHMLGQAWGDSIVLRWAPNNPAFWLKASKEGYIIERLERAVDGEEEKFLVTRFDPLIPPPLDSLDRPEILADSFALMAAQVLHGESMELKSEDDGFYQKMSDLELRYLIAMQAAEQSPTAASILSLRFVDRNVEPGKFYIYSIKIPSMKNMMVSDFLEIDNISQTERDRPFGFEAIPGDHSVKFTWDYSNSNFFSSYFIERSDDRGKTFRLLTPQPLVFLVPEGAKDYVYEYRDTLEENYKPIIYRLRGMTAFAEKSEPAELTTMGIDLTPPPNPKITLGASDPKGITLEWAFDTIPPGDLEGFEIYIGKNGDTLNQKITEELLDPSIRTYRFQVPVEASRAYYFRVQAQDTSGNISTSLSQYVHVIDSIPPSAPTNLNGIIDSAGYVFLDWAHSPEEDLLGYRVFVANRLDDEFAQLTDTLLGINFYADSFPLNTLNRALYFKIAAEDHSRNTSDFSEILMLLKPDTIAPVKPVLQNVKGTGEGVILEWIPSSSTDVDQQIIWRKLKSDTSKNWEIIKSLPGKISEFSDKTPKTEVFYIYALEAVDSSGNRSERCFPRVGRKYFEGETVALKDFSAKKNKENKSISLTWEPNDSEDDFLTEKQRVYFLYRSKNGGRSAKLKQLSSDRKSYTDAAVTPGQYQYGIRIVYDDGKMGEILTSEAIEIKPINSEK